MEEKKPTLRKTFAEKKKELKGDIYDLIAEFSAETGASVTNIVTDNSYSLLTFKIFTDIDIEYEEDL